MEAIARGRGNQLPTSELDALVRLGESALERFGRQPSLQVGLASLLLARGTPQDIVRTRILGQSAVDASRPPPPAVPGARSPAEAIAAPSPIWGTRARLVLAEAFTAASAGLALSLLQEVQDRDPTQRRVFNVRAAAHEAGGSPRAASTDLQARLAVDPDEPRTARALARLFGQVGETAQARKLYERLQANPATQDGPAVIEMAALRAGAERAPAEAMKLVTHALQRGRLTGTEQLRAQLCLARVARAAGDVSTASQAVTAALALSPDDVQAHVQGVLVDLDRSAPDQSAAHLSAVMDRLGDPALAALLEGRVRAAQQRWQAAAEAFDRAAAADARRTDARLWAGAAWAMTGSREQSMQSVAPALHADPYREGPGVPPLWPGDGLKGAAERLVLLSKDDRDGQPLLAEAVLRVHQGDATGAEALVDRILKTGATQAVVLGWKSILLGARGDSAGGARARAGGGGLRRADQRLRPVRPRLGAPGHRRRRGGAARAPRGAEPEPGTSRGPGPARRAGGPLRGHRVRPGTTPACHRARSGVRLGLAGLVPSAAGGLIGRDAGAGPGKRWAGARARLEAGAEPEAQRADLRPRNPGTAALAENRPVAPERPEAVVALAREARADLVVVGPEAPLVAGVADALRAATSRSSARTRRRRGWRGARPSPRR
jgi:tetratricopeptide (TPR) repeat protein